MAVARSNQWPNFLEASSIPIWRNSHHSQPSYVVALTQPTGGSGQARGDPNGGS